MVEKLHSLRGSPGAAEGMDAVVILHRDSPAQETKGLHTSDTMPPGGEDKGGREWLGQAAVKQVSSTSGMALAPGSSEDGQALDGLQHPQVMVSLACLWPKACQLQEHPASSTQYK